eukprot:ANDGO_02675.mRNA.1 FK506-binding protein 2
MVAKIVLCVALCAIMLLTVHGSGEKGHHKPLEKLQIGVLSSPSDCPRMTRQGDKVSVHYTGRLLATGEKFDSSLDRGQPFDFTLGAGMVIKGWDQGLLGACVGEKRRIKIPAVLGYGDRGAGKAIPPNSDLVFDVEVVNIIETESRNHGRDL